MKRAQSAFCIVCLVVGSAIAGCSEKAGEPAPGAGKQDAPARPAVLSLEAKIVADAELKRRNMIANLIEVQASVTSQHPELLRCRVVHQWVLTYHTPTTVVTVDVALDADRKAVVGSIKENPPRAEDGRPRPIQGWNLGAEEAAAVLVTRPGIACADSMRSFSLRMDTVAGKEMPVWHTPYDIEGRRVAVDAGTRQLLEERPAPDGDSRLVLTPLEPK